MGRHSEFSIEIADKICERLALGESLRAVCSDNDMPCEATVYKWLRAYPEFVETYACAREVQADTFVDDILDIADNGTNDWMRRAGADGEASWVENGESLKRSQIRIDARKWLAGKYKPKKYGDKIVSEHTGLGGGAIQIESKSQIINEIMMLIAHEPKNE